jgi:O-antigen/teichoic acid export membrane protein
LIAAVGSGYVLGFDTVVVVGIALAGAEVFTYGVSQTLASVFYADLRSSKTIGPILFASVAYLLAGLTGAAFHQGVWYFLGCLILNSTVLSLVLAYSLRTELGPMGPLAGGGMGRFLREAMPLGILSLVVFSYTRIDTIILGRLAGPEQVGYYAAAYRLTEGSLAIALAVSRTALPAFAVFAASGNEMFSLYRAGLRYLSPVAVAVSASYALAAPLGVTLLYGSAFSPSAFAVAILSIGVGFVFVNQLSTSLLIGMGRYKLLLLISITVLAVNLAATTALVLMWGFQGAAVATVITEGVNLVLQIIAICILARSVAPIKPLAGGILALAVAPCAWIATQAHITLGAAAIAVALALLILLATGNLRIRDFQSLREQYRPQQKVAQ